MRKMPKLFSNDADRKINSFKRWFKGKRAVANVSQHALAERLEISQTAISAKLSTGEGATNITYKDMLIFFDEVGATDEEILHYMRL